MKLPQAPKPPTLDDALPKLPKLPDAFSAVKSAMGPIGTAYGMWGRFSRKKT